MAFTLFFGIRGKRLVTSTSYLPHPKGKWVSIVRTKRDGSRSCFWSLQLTTKNNEVKAKLDKSRKVRRGFLSKREKRQKNYEV